MATHDERLKAVMDAAEALLAAREVDMLTTDEWDALEHAVADATEPPPEERADSFAVDGNQLIRQVNPKRGEPYEHRCGQDAFEEVAHCIDEMYGKSFVLEDLRSAADVPWTQAAVAFAFLKEQGCVTAVHGRKHTAATGSVHTDAMIEWHALREGSPAA